VGRRDFKKEFSDRLLGGGQGRDTLFFAREGFQVYVVDYSHEAVETIARKARDVGLSLVVAQQHDVR
jgi:2-polyprenyl-3-methyl-5-hydroxy-6-metoxy-1,4-benzoquinol methylase